MKDDHAEYLFHKAYNINCAVLDVEFASESVARAAISGKGLVICMPSGSCAKAAPRLQLLFQLRGGLETSSRALAFAFYIRGDLHENSGLNIIIVPAFKRRRCSAAQRDASVDSRFAVNGLISVYLQNS